MNIENARMIYLPKVTDSRGNLSFIEQYKHIPFKLKRTHWIFDVPSEESRGGLAYKRNEEFIVALSGSFDVVVSDGETEQVFKLNRSYYGVYVPAGLWRSMQNFSANAVVLLLASTHYDKDDYIRNYEDFLKNRSNEMPLLEMENENIAPVFNSTAEASTVNHCEELFLQKERGENGNVIIIDNAITVPFSAQRIYYLYDIPGGEERGGHAHRNLHQIIVAVSGSFDVVLDDGKEKKVVSLNSAHKGLKIVPGIWRELVNFSSGSVCLVLASEIYSEEDYIRSYDEFIDFKNN